jgi:hypothetical protein
LTISCSIRRHQFPSPLLLRFWQLVWRAWRSAGAAGDSFPARAAVGGLPPRRAIREAQFRPERGRRKQRRHGASPLSVSPMTGSQHRRSKRTPRQSLSTGSVRSTACSRRSDVGRPPPTFCRFGRHRQNLSGLSGAGSVVHIIDKPHLRQKRPK